MRPAVAYLRVSTDKQAKSGLGIDARPVMGAAHGRDTGSGQQGDTRWMTYREFGQSARDQRGLCRPSGVPQGMAAPSAVVSTCDSDGRVINMLLYASHIDDLLGTELHPSW
jgi:hypothetical protein